MRLTLDLPGLSQAPVPGRPADLLAGLALPALERLLARADPVGGPSGDPEAGLFALMGCAAAGGGPPSAPVARLGEEPPADPGEAWWLRADPVHLRPDLAKLVLVDARGLGLEAGEAGALAAVVAPLLAEAGGALELAAPERWYLRFERPVALDARPLSVVAGQDLRAHLPGGADARRLRALLTEVEMTLFAHPVNQAREARGALPVNGLWLWGGGQVPPVPGRRWQRVHADDPLARGLARLAGSSHLGLPGSAAAWRAGLPRGPGGGEELLFDDRLWRAGRYADLEDWRAALAEVEACWVAPLLEALGRGEIAALTVLDGAGGGWRLSRSALRRWWRRDRPLARWVSGRAGA